MKTKKAYDLWAKNYDFVDNKTRDLDSEVVDEIINKVSFRKVLEIGCGTGKNTDKFASKAKKVFAVDFSPEMLKIAKAKIKADNVEFVETDITKKWSFEKESIDFISCNLTLEHVQDIDFIFSETNRTLIKNGKFFVCELHPFQQYIGKNANFQNENKTIEIKCFTHHLSEYWMVSKKYGFRCLEFDEWFLDQKESEMPRLISFLFEKK